MLLLGVSAVVDDEAGVVVVAVVEMSSVELDIISSMQRLSPETQSSQESSIVGQFCKRTHSDPDVKKVNHLQPSVKSQS